MFRLPLCLLIIYYLFYFIQGQMLGPADMIFKSYEYCDPETKTVDIWIDKQKYNRSVDVLDIFVNTPYDIDEAITLELNGSMKKEGGWKPGSFYYKDMACKAVEKILGDLFFDILHMVDLEQCPLPADDYKIKGFFFDNEKFTVPQVYGEYKMDIFMYQGEEEEEELIGCGSAYYDMVEKEDKEEEEE